MIRLLKSYQPIVLFIIPIITFLLWISPFYSVPNHFFYFDKSPTPLYKWIVDLSNNYHWILVACSLLLTSLLAYLMVHINTKYIFIDTRTYLPAISFILLASSFAELQQLNPAIISGICFYFAFDRLFDSYRKDSILSNSFDSAFLISTGSLFYFNLIYYFPMIWIALVILNKLNWRVILASYLGLLLPYFFIAFYFFYNNQFIKLIDIILMNLNFMHFYKGLNISHLIYISFLVFFISASAIGFYAGINAKKISIRKYYNVLFWFVLFSILIFLFTSSIEILLIMAIPLSLIFSNYLIQIKNEWWSKTIFMVWIILLLYNQLHFYKVIGF